MKRSAILTLLICLSLALRLSAASGECMVSDAASAGSLALAGDGTAAPIWVSSDDYWGVARAAGDLQADVERVTGIKPELSSSAGIPGRMAVIVGTLGHSAQIDAIAKAGKIDASLLEGRWESFLLKVVDDPLPGVKRALVIAGSDKRGTIYGIYTLSKQIGVSPWYWYADVPTAHKDALFVSGSLYDDGPTVKYRGIFINDEAPAFSGWAQEKFGGVNSKMYCHMFELILRMKGNYMWPAMWGNAFNEDDPKNPELADAYGIVMGTSHHEPMIRAQQEWKRHGTGAWNYETNGDVLRKFWSDGIARNKDYESIVTMGMRGDGDEAMSEGTNVALLERIVADQRQILERETGKKATEIPQLWALYKEVQDYYEHGMRVPDDVTLLWCDDNWGNNRRLPLASERNRAGGAGIYYHFDYVGGPRSYKWLNTMTINKTWEQMHLAWKYDATRIWIVNVGDLKPMEYPISFFLDYGWDPEALPYEKLPEYARNWAAQQFGADNAVEVAALIDGYTKLNSLRKPEMLSPETYSVINYDEAGRMLRKWQDLTARAEALNAKIAPAQRDAFFELVLYPIKACEVVNDMYISAALNDLYAMQGRAAANAMADRVVSLFAEDQELARRYNEDIAGGKWAHMMDQKNIGWTYWQQPPLERMPAVSYVHPLPEGALGVAIEGTVAAWPVNDIYGGRAKPLPIVEDSGKGFVFQLFNRGDQPVQWKASTSADWLKLDANSGMLDADGQASLLVSVDWKQVPDDASAGTVSIEGPGPEGYAKMEFRVPLERAPRGLKFNDRVYIESDGCVVIPAGAASKSIGADGLTWKTLPDYSDIALAVTAFPVVHERIVPGGNTPHLEYSVLLNSSGELGVELQVAPTLDFLSGDGIHVAVSFDDEAPQMLHVGTKVGSAEWNTAVGEGIRKLVSKHTITQPGMHVLKVWYVDPGVIIQRIVIDAGGVRPSYLGPDESVCHSSSND